MTVDIVDAHVHVWDADLYPLPWLDPARTGLRARYSVEELVAEAEAAEVSAALCVQAGTSAAEGRWLVETAAGTALLAATVLQYEPAPRPGEWAGRVQPVVDAAPGGVRGIRVPARNARDDLRDVSGLHALLDGLQRRAMVAEFLVRPAQLRAVSELAARYAGLRMVLCHLGGVDMEGPDPDWTAALNALRRQPNIAAKVSGMLPRTLPTHARRTRIARVLAAAVETFGPGRLMVGSDWPISVGAHRTYTDVFALTRDLLPSMDEAGTTALFAGTAVHTYRLG